MKTPLMLMVTIAGMAMAGAQNTTNSPPPSAVPTVSSQSTNSEGRPVSASLKINPQSAVTPTTATTIPPLVLKESEIIKSKSGTEYRGILVGSPRPVGGKFNPLQMINPLAPAGYGLGVASATSQPRIFRDERTHEPEGITIIRVTR